MWPSTCLNGLEECIRKGAETSRWNVPPVVMEAATVSNSQHERGGVLGADLVNLEN